ncbi:hypothetical protein [Rhodococcus sp. 06-235-1A]|uniref:hypothetical protein n=1 Tax=Rhodococcus sp. 06-235-1A TaxID=2022508 RepID=UPI000B9C223F|nr:hypothetical protein [Rhodococcus sp. 06-235-1A]
MADVSDALTTCHHRIDRAAELRAEMSQEWNAHLATKPRGFELVHGPTPDTWEMRIKTMRPTPRSLSTRFGEWLYQLRAALDGLTYALAIRDSGEDPPPKASSVYFPIFDSAKKFQQNRPRLTALNDETVAELELVQPYRAAPDHLSNVPWWINELARLDRHRSGHAVRAFVSSCRVGFREPITGELRLDGNGAVEVNEERGTTIAVITAPPGLGRRDIQDLIVDIDVQNIIDVPEWRHRSTPPMSRSTLDLRMKYSEAWVANTLAHFRP